MNASRTLFSESVQLCTLKLESDAAEWPRPEGSAMTIRTLLVVAGLLGVLISLVLPAPAPRPGGLAVLRAGAAAD